MAQAAGTQMRILCSAVDTSLYLENQAERLDLSMCFRGWPAKTRGLNKISSFCFSSSCYVRNLCTSFYNIVSEPGLQLRDGGRMEVHVEHQGV